MKIQPQSTITLYSGVDIGTEQQLAFSSKAKQTAYFNSKVKKSYVNCTVVKDKIGQLKVAVKPVGQADPGEITGVDLAACNYMSFINPNFDNKTIYCYLIDYEFDNNETAIIYYTIDYWQTWMFDVTFHDMYIDREHLNVDDWNKVDANPYRQDVPQMITAEPLPTPKGYEKAYYEVGWWDGDSKDAKAFMTSAAGTTDSEKALAITNMLHGSWKYWNVMLILAPTDWSKFATEETSAYLPGDVCYYSQGGTQGVYYCGVATSGDWDPNAWFQIYPANVVGGVPIFDPYNPDVSVPGRVVPEAWTEFVIANNGHCYQNLANTAKTLNVYNPSSSADFASFQDCGLCSTYAASGPLAELNRILSQYHIDMVPAGTTVTTSGHYTWSAKPRGCDVFLIDNANAWQELATFFSTYNAVSQIVGIYGVPASFLGRGTIDKGSLTPGLSGMGNADNVSTSASAYRTGITGSGKQKAVRNKKLYTSPFSYLRVVSPDGSVKEFSYENFRNLSRDGEQSVKFKLIANITGDAPQMFLVPYLYKTENVVDETILGLMTSSDEAESVRKTMKFNVDECICIDGFPEISFNTDGYLTFLSSAYAGYAANNSTNTQKALEIEQYNTNMARNMTPAVLGSIGNMAADTAKGAAVGGWGGAAVGAITGAGEATYNIYDAYQTNKLNREMYKNIKNMYTEANQWASGDLISTDDPYVDRFDDCKPAFANSVYFGGTGGVIKYLRAMGLFDFVAIHVQLREEILDYYDKWFDLYGYSSGRCGIPYVVNFVHGQTADTKVPHWATVNNVPTTYVKTHDAKVEHAMLPVAQHIANMFNAGIRMMKGDLT